MKKTRYLDDLASDTAKDGSKIKTHEQKVQQICTITTASALVWVNFQPVYCLKERKMYDTYDAAIQVCLNVKGNSPLHADYVCTSSPRKSLPTFHDDPFIHIKIIEHQKLKLRTSTSARYTQKFWNIKNTGSKLLIGRLVCCSNGYNNLGTHFS